MTDITPDDTVRTDMQNCVFFCYITLLSEQCKHSQDMYGTGAQGNAGPTADPRPRVCWDQALHGTGDDVHMLQLSGPHAIKAAQCSLKHYQWSV